MPRSGPRDITRYQSAQSQLDNGQGNESQIRSLVTFHLAKKYIPILSFREQVECSTGNQECA